jgi:alkaline phosphatase
MRSVTDLIMNSPSASSTSRRGFLRASVLTSALFGAEKSLTASETRRAEGNGGQAKNVIMLVSDGMNHGALALARQYQLNVEQREPHWMTLYRERPMVRSLAETFSANSCVTDSAAAASAWGGGKRVANGAINVLADGAEVTPLHEKLQRVGRKTGLVTTATVTHATPAGFAANVSSRADEGVIAEQYLARKVDVLMGGGQKFFSAELRQKYEAAGYEVYDERRKLMRAARDEMKPLLGVFSESHLPYSIDRNNVESIAEVVPTLAEMAQVALDRLKQAKEGFFLMIEGARVDHAGHANDAAASIHDQLAFDEAIGVAVAFMDQHPDTLLIITTDHGCGGIQMNGVSAKANQEFAPGLYNASNVFFDRIKGFNRSVEWMKQNGVDGISGAKLGTALKQFTGLELQAEEQVLAQGLKSSWSEVVKAHTGIGWTSGNHTSELVEFCAFGPGSEAFPAFVRNFEVHDLVLRAMGMGV